jgi:hypothetical protein
MDCFSSKSGAKGKLGRFERLTPGKIEEIQKLVKSGLSLRCVTRKTGVSYSSVYRHAKQFAKRQTFVDFSVFSERELGYIVGFFVGDGSRIADARSGHCGARFAFDAKGDVEIASLLQRLFRKAGKSVTLYSEGTWLAMKVYSKGLLVFLQDFVRYAECDGKVCKVLVNSLNWDRAFALGFVGGLIDADGHVYKNKRHAGHFGIATTTVSPTLTEQLVDLLNRLGLKPKVSAVKPSRTSFSKKITYILRLGKAEFGKICGEMICVKHEECGCDAKRF